jgi:uncharacterized repeat protein (TIGR01451 family)
MMIMTLILSVVVSYAWFIMIKRTEPIVIQTGSLTTLCTFYYGIDSNYDGVLDDGAYEEIMTENITFSNTAPGQVYTYKIVIKNTGSIPGFLNVTMNDIIATTPSMIDGFSLSFQNPLPKQFNQIDSNLTLFSDYILNENTTFDFVFQIRVKDTVSSALRFESLTIKHFTISLNQIH